MPLFARPQILLVGFGLIAGVATVLVGAESDASAFRARDTAGVEHVAVEKDARATVWLFIAHDCPISNSYAPEIGRIVAEYSPRGARVNLVYEEAGFEASALAAHAEAHGYHAPLFRDPDGRIARACGLTVTPAVAVLDSSGQVVYRGRIDDRYAAIGRERSQITSHDLRDALDAVLAGRPVAIAQTKAIGCFIAPAGP